MFTIDPDKKLKAGIIGATGMVGQRFITLLKDHPFFDVAVLAASPRSAGKTYEEALGSRWKLDEPMPDYVKNMVIMDASDVEAVSSKVDFVFCAVDMKKDEIRALEEAYAKAETPVVSNNSAHRHTPDVPMVVPEINPEHLEIIAQQKKRLGTKNGFIAVKPNCSIQCYVPHLTPLLKYKPTRVVATTYQAISGAGKTFREWPEMQDNVIPFIGGEEEKSEIEPLKVWGKISGGEIVPTAEPVITTQCVRVPVTNGHMAAVFVDFENKPAKEQILEDWKNFSGKPQEYKLPHAPEQFITYFEEDNRPQTGVDRGIYGGMGVTCGRLREDKLFDYKFIGLAHNTLRGAAGGAVLIAELLCAEGYLTRK
ncbi:MAG: aspartate-semialdehyde dehydrogenase [Clostridia bacterium]|nr:aspartate-semialdehyde dehydrogenase [Clostridia bacterium]